MQIYHKKRNIFTLNNFFQQMHPNRKPPQRTSKQRLFKMFNKTQNNFRKIGSRGGISGDFWKHVFNVSILKLNFQRKNVKGNPVKNGKFRGFMLSWWDVRGQTSRRTVKRKTQGERSARNFYQLNVWVTPTKRENARRKGCRKRTR